MTHPRGICDIGAAAAGSTMITDVWVSVVAILALAGLLFGVFALICLHIAVYKRERAVRTAGFELHNTLTCPFSSIRQQPMHCDRKFFRHHALLLPLSQVPIRKSRHRCAIARLMSDLQRHRLRDCHSIADTRSHCRSRLPITF